VFIAALITSSALSSLLSSNLLLLSIGGSGDGDGVAWPPVLLIMVKVRGGTIVEVAAARVKEGMR
jgi:hypothetical protein